MDLKMRQWSIAIATLVCIFLAGQVRMAAQEYRGSLSGTVTDSTGAVVPEAKITIQNRATNVTLVVGSTNRGDYTALNLDAGMYKVTVAAKGFKTLVRENVEVRTGEKLGLDLALEVGAAGETVEVTTESPQLITDTGSGGTVLNSDIIGSLPLLGSNVFSLINDTNGNSHIGAFPDHLSERPFDNGGFDAYSMNGGPSGGNNNSYLIDGAPNNNNEGAGFVPPPDAVSQVNVMTNAYDAEYGRTGGGITSIALKTGVNKLHGVLYWNLRNDHLDASLAQNVGKPRQVTQWSEPGFWVGGPILIPHVYNGRDKSFFSFSYEHFFDKLPSSISRTVASPAELQGNFCSGATGNSGIGTVIYDPTSNIVNGVATGPRTAFGGCPSGQTGSLIPSNRIDPVVESILSNGALANIAGCSNPRTAGCATNYTAPNGHGDHYYAITTRIDQNFSQTEKFFASYVDGNRLEYILDPGAPTAASNLFFPTSNTYRINHGATANLTSILSPTFTSTAKISWLRHNGVGIESSNGATASSLGLSPALNSLFAANNFPEITTSGSTVNYTEFGAGSFQTTAGRNTTTLADNWTAQETLNKVIGSHSLKGGGGTTITLENNNANSQIPPLAFTDQFTRASYLTASSSGDPIASALLGYPATVSYTNPFRASYKTSYVGMFVQDDWRVSKKLTLNLGVRYDFQTPPHERYNRAVIGFNPGAPSLAAGTNPVSGAINGGGGQYLGGLVYADPNNRSPFANAFKDLGPRFGFAYKVNDKLVVRGGWGRFFDYAGAYNFPPATGFQSISSANTTSDGGQTPTLCVNTTGCAVPSTNPQAGLAANGFASLFPNGLVPITGSSLGAKTGAGTAVTFIDPQFKPDFVNQFNLGVEYQLPARVLVHLEYNGSRGRNVPVTASKSIDSLTASQFLALGAAANTTVANPFAGQLPGTTLNGATVTQGQLLIPYPQFTNVSESNLSIGQLWYNSLQARADKRLTHGLTLQANFTWGKNLGTVSYLNPNYDSLTALSRQLISIDQTFMTNIVMTYKLPIFSDPSHRLLHTALGGWTVSGTAQFQSGPLAASPASGSAIYTGVNPTKNIPGVFTGHTMGRWFNNCVINSAGTAILASSISAGCPAGTPLADAPWQQPVNSYFLNNIPPFFNGNRLSRPPQATLAVFKAFAITETVKFEIRADAFNLTNTPFFGQGDNSAGFSSLSPTSTSFGALNFNQGNDPRLMQVTARLSF